jgi:hypothetical protein
VDPGPISIILLSPVYFTRTVYFTCILLLFSTRYAHTLLFQANWWDWPPHRKLGTKYLVVCVQVPRCYWPKTSQQESLNGALVGVLLGQSASPSVVLSALLLNDKPCFLTEGKDLPLCSTYFRLGVSQLPGHNHHQLHAIHQNVAFTNQWRVSWNAQGLAQFSRTDCWSLVRGWSWSCLACSLTRRVSHLRVYDA